MKKKLSWFKVVRIYYRKISATVFVNLFLLRINQTKRKFKNVHNVVKKLLRIGASVTYYTMIGMVILCSYDSRISDHGKSHSFYFQKSNKIIVKTSKFHILKLLWVLLRNICVFA